MGQNNTAFVINGYSYADAKFIFNGIIVPGIKSFSFKVKKTKTNNYGMGENPDSRSRGKKEYEGSLGMTHDSAKILKTLSPTGLLTEIPAGVAILSLVRTDGRKEVITMNFFEWMSDGLEGSEGDEDLQTDNDVIFGSMQKQSF
jgi:hypothetical protein